MTTAGNVSNRTLHSVCGSFLVELSLIADGRSSTLLKCSDHLSKIASLSEPRSEKTGHRGFRPSVTQTKL